MVEPEYSVFTGGDTPDQERPPASKESVFGSESMVMRGCLLESSGVLERNRARIYKIIDEIEENASSFLAASLQEMGLVSEKLRVLETGSDDLRRVVEASPVKQVDEVVTQPEAQENTLSLLYDSVTKTFEGLKSEFKDEAQGLYNSIHDKLRELEKAEVDFDLRQRVETERLNRESKLLEAKKNELTLLEEAITERSAELKRKEEIFEVKQKEQAEKLRDETELTSNDQMEYEEISKQPLIKADTRKRSNLEFELPLLVDNDSGDAGSVTRLAKKQKSQEADSACALSQDTDPAAKQKNDATDGDIGGLDCTDKSVEYPESMSTFVVDQVWALRDPRDDMPRIYALIRNVFGSQLSLQVTLLEHVKTTKYQNSIIPRACGRFKYRDTEIKSHLMFAQKMHHIKCGQYVIVNPRKGETWALFRDWDITWNTQRNLREPPYRYDYVEVISEFDDHQGISVELISVKHGIINIVIPPEEMQRFSHKVASCIGEEKEGVPAGSVELNPGATPSYIPVLEDCGNVSTVKDQVGSTKDLAIIID